MEDNSSDSSRRFYIPIVLTFLAIILGMISFDAVFPDYPFFRKLNYTFQLFTLESGDRFYENGNQPLSLTIIFYLAWIFAVAAIFSTIILAILAVVKYRFFLSRVRFMKGHTILCGLGDIGKAIAGNMDDIGKLIIVEKDTSNEDLVRLRKDGAKVIDANALDITILNRLGIEHAECLFALTGDDFDNLTIINHANGILKKKKKNKNHNENHVKLAANIDSRNLKAAVTSEWLNREGNHECVLRHMISGFIESANELKKHPGNRHLKELFEASKNTLSGYDPANENLLPGLENIRLFNINQMAGRYLFLYYPPDRFRRITSKDDKPMEILLIGFSNIGEEILKLCFQNCHYINRNRTKITIVSYDGDIIDGKIRSKFRNLDELFELKIIKQNPHHMSQKLLSDNGLMTVDVIYICSSEDRYQASYSSKVRELYGEDKPVVRPFFNKDVLCKAENFGNTYSFNIFTEVACKENIINESLDHRAIAVHNRWIGQSISNYIEKAEPFIENGEPIPSPKPTLAPWHQVSEEIREDNRSVVDHINVKLRSVLQLNDPEYYDHPRDAGINFEFLNEKKKDNKIDELAEMEHRRWMANKFICGWLYSKNRNDSEKKHDCLKDFILLDQKTKDFDQQQIKDMRDIIELNNDQDPNKKVIKPCQSIICQYFFRISSFLKAIK